MISKSERLLIFRFLFSKKSDGYVSIFAWFSIIGISLGVASIIIVMSVMNGFRIDLTNRIIGLNSHLNIYSFDNEITNKQADELILNIDNSFFYQQYKSIETNGLIIKSNKFLTSFFFALFNSSLLCFFDAPLFNSLATSTTA